MSSDSDFSVAMEHQHVLTRLVDWSGAFSSGSNLLLADQSLGHKDKTVVVEVLGAGPGNISRGVLNECTVQPGDLVVVNWFHKTHELLLQGDNVITFNWEHIMAKVVTDETNKTASLAPLQAFIICKRNEDKAQKIMMGADSVILAPSLDSQVTGGSRYNEKGKPQEQMRVAIEEVVACGPGSVVDGAFQTPPQMAGDMVMYDTSVSPVQFRLQGEAYTMVHYRSVIMTFRDASGKVVLS